LAGWKNGVVVIDVVNRKLLWAAKPKDEANLADVAFSPDGKLIYAGGTTGCIHVMETLTGKLLAQWYANESGKPVYGYRISTVTVSRDGRFIAAGVGPIGLVWVWSADGKTVAVLNHGDSTIRNVLFSPDSKFIATVAGSRIKIWNLDAGSSATTESTEETKHGDVVNSRHADERSND